MATDYLRDWTKKVDTKNGGFHLAHKSGNHTISFLPNREKGGYDIKHSGKLVGHHANAAGALKQAVGYFKQNYNKEAPANVNFPSSPAKIPVNKAEQDAPNYSNISIPNYFKNKLNQIKGVHKPYMDQGESFAGEMVRQNSEQSSPNRVKMAKEIHGQKLKELIGIKPNLPKAEMTPHSKGAKYSSPAEGTSALDEQRHAHLKGVNSPMDSVGSSNKTKSQHVLKEIKTIKPNLPKAELEKAKVDEGKPVVTKINDRNARYFRDRLMNIKGSFARGVSKDNAKMTHDSTMSHLKETKPNLPKSELNTADKDEYKLIGSAPTKEALEAHAKKHFYSDSVHFKPEPDGTHSVHNSKGKIEGLRVKSSKNRHRLERKISK